MSILRIRIYGDPILKRKARPVEKVGPDEKQLFDDMAQTMYAANGVGLAANQVGVEKQLIVVDVGKGLFNLANPRVLKAECEKMGEEGCLSLPEITVKLKRPEKITVEALNHDGVKVKLETEGIIARAIQHEIDHLKGIVITDRAGIKQKLLLSKKLRKLTGIKY